MICEIEGNGPGAATNWLRAIEQQRATEGREWARKKLEEDIQKQAIQVAAICPKSGVALPKTRWRRMQLRTSVGVVERAGAVGKIDRAPAVGVSGKRAVGPAGLSESQP